MPKVMMLGEGILHHLLGIMPWEVITAFGGPKSCKISSIHPDTEANPRNSGPETFETLKLPSLMNPQ